MGDLPKLFECACERLTTDPSGVCRDCRELAFQRRNRHISQPELIAIDDGGSIPLRGARTAAAAETRVRRF